MIPKVAVDLIWVQDGGFVGLLALSHRVEEFSSRRPPSFKGLSRFDVSLPILEKSPLIGWALVRITNFTWFPWILWRFPAIVGADFTSIKIDF
ncbi:hypothetical protein SH449x_001240 [Pirellulaceae bacterium SH449]